MWLVGVDKRVKVKNGKKLGSKRFMFFTGFFPSPFSWDGRGRQSPVTQTWP